MTEAFIQGRLAYQNNQPKSHNPYKPSSKDWWEWNIGWSCAKKSNAA